ncbi:hypothetical protein BN8_00259 [Fibrisoma limi BUZ 3]|uniref:Macroglobulin domain-containing protein n=1 Tax=Fibrisoma limi BUZ 3 TaxID=1185876 RepID=I2GBR7_9BACT|nr:hypothetical protein [Fibrisoma limi]CCH51341.1 hypothetical protein BN8_00259 [Fibrisoma limi BUZ 3]
MQNLTNTSLLRCMKGNQLRFVCCLLLLVGYGAAGQPAEGLQPVVQRLDQYRKQTLQEKVFVHADRAFYLTGEMLWFKVYCVDGTFHRPLDVSKVAYVEVLDRERKPVVQAKVALTAGSGNGAFFLPTSINSGHYLLRAYTNWMKNFGADFFFEKPITIVNSFKRLELPVLAAAPDYDVQLFPEGGQLVQGLSSKVAFRVTDESGKGIAFRGALVNQQNDTVSRFTPQRFGIGHFMVTPEPNTTYRVVITDEKGRAVVRPLPAVQAQGYTMRLEETGGDQLKVTVSTNVVGQALVYLLGHTRQVVNVAEMRPMQQEATFLIDKKKLGDGISHLTVFNMDRRPVCERLYFKRPEQSLNIGLTPDKSEYASRTKVSIDVTLPSMAKNGAADLSVAVYRLDSLPAASSGNLLSYLWLTSDLRGTIESPEYYVQAENPDVKEAVDNLMLTHGWRRFTWDNVLTKPSTAFQFAPEYNGLVVQGMVKNPVSGAPVKGITTYLSTIGKPIRFYVAESDTAGRVLFELKDAYGPKQVVVRTEPADSLNRLSIINPFAEQWSATRLPAFDLSQQTAESVLNRSVAMQVQNTYWSDRSVRYRYPVVDSTAFYGKTDESYKLDDYTRFTTMEDVLREYVLGIQPRKRQGKFRLVVINAPYRAFFDEPSLVLMDGVPVFDMDRIMAFSPLKINRLDVMTKRYFIGRTVFNGLISFSTYKGDLAGFELDPGLLKVDYDGLQLQREFYAPRYDTPRQFESRLPDARTLLYWSPGLAIDASGKGKIEFFTSDQEGRYVIDVNGLTKQGQGGSQQTTFTVKNPVR